MHEKNVISVISLQLSNDPSEIGRLLARHLCLMLLSPTPSRFLAFSLRPSFLKCLYTFPDGKSASDPLHCLRVFFHRPNCLPHFDYVLSLVSVLKACSSLLAISHGRQIHSLLVKTGYVSNTFVRNSLINMYAKCGCLDDAEVVFESFSELDPVSCNIMAAGYMKSRQPEKARQVFDVMPSKNFVSYTTMIMGYAKNGFWNEAIEFFKVMRSEAVVPNEVTMASVISACSHVGAIWDCWKLHGLAIKLQLVGLVLISTNLLHFYSLCSRLEDAIRLFTKMPDKNIVSWNVMLNGYAKAGLVDQARDLFEIIPEKDVISWGTMIDGYVQVKRLNEAVLMYGAMRCCGVEPNEVMIVNLVSACGQAMSFVEGQLFHGVIVKIGFDCYEFIQTTLISFYAGCGTIDLAELQFQASIKEHIASWNALISGFMRNGMIERGRKTFEGMPERDIFSWTIVISGYTQSEQPEMALELFRRMVESGVQPNEITMVSVLSAIANRGQLTDGRWAHEYIRNNTIALSDNLRAALIDMYAKCGSVNNSLDLFYQIQHKVSSVSPWNAIICGLAMHGYSSLSLTIFGDLQKQKIPLNAITFIGVLSACCHAGLVDAGERYFEMMKSVYKIEPNIKHYGCMVDLLGRAGRVEEAEEMIRNMPMEADVVIWGTLLAACRTHGHVEIGERAAEKLARAEPTHGGGRVLLYNIYADSGMWEDAYLVRKAMQSLNTQQSPGYSGVV